MNVVRSVDVIHVIVTQMERMMAQNIYISGPAANARIEKAIPKFIAKFGMAKDQATAVAIRLESLGRLEMSGSPINKPKKDRGLPIPVAPLAVLQSLRAMKRNNQPRSTVIRENTGGDTYESTGQAQRASSRSSRSSRLRSRVTRGR